MSADHEQAERIRENVAHIARGCRSSLSHNPAVYEQAVAADLAALAARLDEAQREPWEYVEHEGKTWHRCRCCGTLERWEGGTLCEIRAASSTPRDSE